MSRFICSIATLLAIGRILAAERHFDFSGAKANESPAGFRSVVTGEGKPGEWKVIADETSSGVAATNATASLVIKHQVLAQLSQDSTDEHFPLLIFDGEVFNDFVLTTRFKTVGGDREQMAGIAFRIQDEKNYYVARASSLGSTFRFYKLVDGVRLSVVGPDIEIPKGVWHELTIDCKGTQIRCLLNGKQIIPTINDSAFAQGKIGFWTKSDSVSYFADTKIVYTPKETLAVQLVRQTLRKYPRLRGLKIFASTPDRKEVHTVASDDEKELGQPAGKVGEDVATNGAIYYGREDQEVVVTMPLRDRNGDSIAAVRVIMKSFPGQTEQNALARATPIVREMEKRVRSADDLTQ